MSNSHGWTILVGMRMYRSFREQSTAGSGQCEQVCTSEHYSKVLLTKKIVQSIQAAPESWSYSIQSNVSFAPHWAARSDTETSARILAAVTSLDLCLKLKSPHFEHKSGGVHAGPT